ncbi:orotate phosphoribosyltransferase Ura5 [Corchorus olitorius]|uniref:Orotate phosphoribosyltransferase Ura5 n=1 Tax=Corchorus olitorius TaxID=93759 RepID=A0A1R3H3P7_9ROSI|nr:orotate phosphoribosyltransferase Ura5 [Corchorus olitorius]
MDCEIDTTITFIRRRVSFAKPKSVNLVGVLANCGSEETTICRDITRERSKNTVPVVAICTISREVTFVRADLGCGKTDADEEMRDK